MKLFLHLHILTFLVLIGTVNGQIDSLFSKVTHAQKLRLQNIFSEERDSIFSEFETTINLLFNCKTLCTKLPDTSNHYFLVNKLQKETIGKTLAYAFMNNIVISTSENFRIYSWDNLDGGSSHSYTNYLLYMNEADCIIFPMDTSNQDLEVGYYYIKQIKDYFIAFGYGTYGGGKQHFIIRLFKNEDGKIAEYNEGYPEGQPIVIHSNRSQNVWFSL